MLKKKKKGGGDKEKKVRRKCLNERETVAYEQQILDNNRQLSRLISLKSTTSFSLFLARV